MPRTPNKFEEATTTLKIAFGDGKESDDKNLKLGIFNRLSAQLILHMSNHDFDFSLEKYCQFFIKFFDLSIPESELNKENRIKELYPLNSKSPKIDDEKNLHGLKNRKIQMLFEAGKLLLLLKAKEFYDSQNPTLETLRKEHKSVENVHNTLREIKPETIEIKDVEAKGQARFAQFKIENKEAEEAYQKACDEAKVREIKELKSNSKKIAEDCDEQLSKSLDGFERRFATMSDNITNIKAQIKALEDWRNIGEFRKNSVLRDKYFKTFFPKNPLEEDAECILRDKLDFAVLPSIDTEIPEDPLRKQFKTLNKKYNEEKVVPERARINFALNKRLNNIPAVIPPETPVEYPHQAKLRSIETLIDLKDTVIDARTNKKIGILHDVRFAADKQGMSTKDHWENVRKLARELEDKDLKDWHKTCAERKRLILSKNRELKEIKEKQNILDANINAYRVATDKLTSLEKNFNTEEKRYLARRIEIRDMAIRNIKVSEQSVAEACFTKVYSLNKRYNELKSKLTTALESEEKRTRSLAPADSVETDPLLSSSQMATNSGNLRSPHIDAKAQHILSTVTAEVAHNNKKSFWSNFGLGWGIASFLSGGIGFIIYCVCQCCCKSDDALADNDAAQQRSSVASSIAPTQLDVTSHTGNKRASTSFQSSDTLMNSRLEKHAELRKAVNDRDYQDFNPNIKNHLEGLGISEDTINYIKECKIQIPVNNLNNKLLIQENRGIKKIPLKQGFFVDLETKTLRQYSEVGKKSHAITASTVAHLAHFHV